MIELLIACFFVTVVLLAVLGLMRPQRLKVSAAVGGARLTLEADSGDAPKACPSRGVLELWARTIGTR
jgi:hypothetical protein